jgi:hypothetical protein
VSLLLSLFVPDADDDDGIDDEVEGGASLPWTIVRVTRPSAPISCSSRTLLMVGPPTMASDDDDEDDDVVPDVVVPVFGADEELIVGCSPDLVASWPTIQLVGSQYSRWVLFVERDVIMKMVFERNSIV